MKLAPASNLTRYALMVMGAVALAGCAGTPIDDLPASNIVAVDGMAPITFKAPSNGQVTIYDQSVDNQVYSGLIRKDKLVIIDPATKNVTVDGMVANSKPFYGGNSLKITFEASN